MDIATAAGLALALALHFAARLAPPWPLRHQGCDAYYFLLCAEAFRRRPRLPIILPKLYLLEPEEQWYPPLFPVLIALLPPAWLHRGHWLVSQALDAGVTAALYLWLAEHAGIPLALLTAFVYATEANLVSEYRSMTPRALGVILVLGYLAAAAAAEADPAWLILAGLCVAALVYTHKLSLQLLWFAAPALSLVRADLAWVAAVILGYAIAAAVSPRLFWKVHRAHFDILGFWNRNWAWLGAHQVRDAPLHGQSDRYRGFHGARGTGLLRLHTKRLVLANPWIVPALVPLLAPGALSSEGLLLLQAALAFTAWALLTLMIPALRFLGEGTKYAKYAEPLCLLVVALGLASPAGPWVAAASLLVLALHFYHFRRIWRDLRTGFHPVGVMNEDLRAILSAVATAPSARLLCLPTHLADLVAYTVRRPVLWGTHGYGFRAVEPFFPVLRRPIDEFIADYGLTHALLDRRYVAPQELRFSQACKVEFERGDFLLLTLATPEQAAADAEIDRKPKAPAIP